jgi:hypothetical protein
MRTDAIVSSFYFQALMGGQQAPNRRSKRGQRRHKERLRRQSPDRLAGLTNWQRNQMRRRGLTLAEARELVHP